MAKKGTKQVAPPVPAPNPASKAGSSTKGSKISDELRQAVKDLGGDDDDLDLIDGIDSDNEESAVPVKQRGGEKSMDEVSERCSRRSFT
jgi:hypothetical protein